MSHEEMLNRVYHLQKALHTVRNEVATGAEAIRLARHETDDEIRHEALERAHATLEKEVALHTGATEATDTPFDRVFALRTARDAVARHASHLYEDEPSARGRPSARWEARSHALSETLTILDEEIRRQSEDCRRHVAVTHTPTLETRVTALETQVKALEQALYEQNVTLADRGLT